MKITNLKRLFILCSLILLFSFGFTRHVLAVTRPPASPITISDLNKTWTVTFSQKLDTTTINTQNITVEDSGTPVNISTELGNDGKTILIKPPLGGYLSGHTYMLTISAGVRSIAPGLHPLSKAIYKLFTVKSGKMFESTYGFKIPIPETWEDGTYYIFDSHEYPINVSCDFVNSKGDLNGGLFSIIFTSRPSTNPALKLIATEKYTSNGIESTLYYYFRKDGQIDSKYLSTDDYNTYITMYNVIPEIQDSVTYIP